MTSLLQLPLVLVQDIIELIVLSERDWLPLLSLREVNKFFENEISRNLARHKLYDPPYSCVASLMPESFRLHLLREYLGDHARRNATKLVVYMHSVIDFLVSTPQYPDDRHKIIMGICKALMYSGLEWRIYLRSYPQYPEPQWSPKQSDIQHTAFAVAIAMNLPVASMMLLERTNLASTSCMYLGTPLRIAIMHGDTAMVSALIDSGATAYIQNYYVVRNYLQLAVKEDACFEAITLTLAHIKTINPKTSLFQWCLQDIYEKAALQRKTALVTYLLGRWTLEFSVVCHWRVLISYCGYGDFELVQKLVGLVYNDASWVSTKQDGRTPLDKAAERGDLRLCRFLLENLDSIHLHQREEQCWYYAARSGNIEILELLEKYSPEKAALPAYASVLPAAAGAGHLDMAKYAVHRQFDRAKSKKGGKQANPEAIRSFANLFAVINNKRSMVCYLVDELGVDINGEDIHPGHGLTPLRMAIDAGHPEMVQLLLERGAVPPSISALEADFKPGRREPRKSFLGFKSCLPIHHERGKYKLGTVRAVKAAIEVVRCSQEQRFA